jgi:intracellular sulfur oxidation DsrE/DsrF family protein
MNRNNTSNKNKQRRGFLEFIVSRASLLGIFPLSFNSKTAIQTPIDNFSEDEQWFDKIKGKHRMVFDATQPHGIYPFAWPNVFLMTNAQTGTPEKDCSVVVVLRHTAIAYAFEHKLWAKYKFGELFKVNNPATNIPYENNPFWEPKDGEYKMSGIGKLEIGINELQKRGVMFCVCDMAITAFTARLADTQKQDPSEIKAEWLKSLLPNIHVVPSGVWALGRAQEHGCAYCFAG